MAKALYSLITKSEFVKKVLIFIYKIRGKKPWSLGYIEYKWEYIVSSLKDKNFLQYFREKKLPAHIGIGLDERSVEYAWVFSNLEADVEGYILDAGSVLNYSQILKLDLLKNKQLTIFTYYPELENFNQKRISYVYGDLRNMFFQDEYFDEIICQSTIEHVDMDNSMYGYKISNSSKIKNKSYEYMKVIAELHRTLKKNGNLFLTFPFGKFENYGFFQQFDSEMLGRIKEFLDSKGELKIDFIKYTKNGWNFCKENDCGNIVSYNPHTGMGKGDDGAAHCRAICCIKFSKK